MGDEMPPPQVERFFDGMISSPQRRSAVRQLVMNWSVILVGMVLSSGLSTIALILLARRVDPVIYGQYVASFSLTSFLVVLPGFGLDAWLLTEPRADRRSAEELLRRAVRARLILLLPWLGAMLLLGFILPRATFPLSLLLPISLGVAADSITLLVYASLRTQDRHQPVTWLQGASALLLFAFVLVLPSQPDAVTYFAVGRAFLSLLLVAVVLLRYMGQTRQVGSDETRTLLRTARPFMAAEVASAVYVKADVTLLGLLLGAVATAIYGPAVNLLQMSFMTLRALFFFSVPRLARAFRHSHIAFRSESYLQIAAQLILGLAASLLFYLFADDLVLFLYRDRYATSAAVLRLLSPIPLLRALNFALGGMLSVSGLQASRSRVQAIVAAASVAGNLIVIFPFGVSGVALVYVASELILTMGYAYLTLKRLTRQAHDSPTHLSL